METTTAERKKKYNGVWVLADLLGGKVREVTFQLMARARILADQKRTTMSVVVLGNGIRNEAEELTFYGADSVIYADSPEFSYFREEALAEGIITLIEKHKPEILIGSASGQGRSLLPRIAVKSRTGLTADCTELEIDPQTGLLLQTRPAFGGNLIATIKTENYRPQMATVRPHVFGNAPRSSKRAELIHEDLVIPDAVLGLKTVLGETLQGAEKGGISNSHIIITGGRGVRGKEGFDLLKEFAELTGAALGATRAAVDLGWVPYEHQIGQSGLTVRSKIYIACGVSGQVQHLVGMRNCECIISINTDENAPIMKLSDIAIVGDVFDIIPEMIAFVKREKGYL